MSDRIHRLPSRARTRSNVVFGILVLMLSVLASACGAGGSNSSQATITVAAVGNPQMEDLQKLVPEFEKAHSDIKVKIVILPENQLRQQVTQDVATHSGRFDLSMIGTYEVPLWAKNGWIQNLDRKSTRLNSSHLGISYAVFCLKKKKKKEHNTKNIT